MNEAGKLIADGILGDHNKVISVAGKSYVIKMPSVKVMTRTLREWAQIGVEGNYTSISILAEVPENAPHLALGLAYMIVGDVSFHWLKAKRVYSKLIKGNNAELKHGVKESIALMNGEDFFEAVTLAKSVSQMLAKL
jgi:hypothetical protein